jgi:fibronectin type 3 domain-containing protein
VAGYRVYYGLASRTYAQALGSGLAAGSGSSFVVSDLKAGSLYYFAVTAVDASGNESGYSNEVSKQLQ